MSRTTIEIRVGRPAPDRLVQRLADDLVEPDLLLLAEPRAALDVDLDLDLVLDARAGSPARTRRRANPWSRSTTGSMLNERSRSERIVSRWRLERRGHDPARRPGPPVVDRLHRRVEHQRDPGEVLHRPVVQEEREPAPLVLLGGDDPLDEALALVVGNALRHPSVDDRVSQGDRDRVRARVRLELGEDVADVALHRLLADEEPRGDVRVRHPVGEELQDLALARR